MVAMDTEITEKLAETGIKTNMALSGRDFEPIPKDNLMTDMHISKLPGHTVPIDKIVFNDQGSAAWYKRQFGDGFPDSCYEIMEAYSNGVRYKEWKYILRKLRKRKDKVVAQTVVEHLNKSVTFD